MAINQQSIELHIEELVLHGFAPGQRYQVAAGLQMELNRLFAEKGLPASFNGGFHIDQLNAGSFLANDTADNTSAGNRIAGAVYNSFMPTDKK